MRSQAVLEQQDAVRLIDDAMAGLKRKVKHTPHPRTHAQKTKTKQYCCTAAAGCITTKHGDISVHRHVFGFRLRSVLGCP